MVRVLMNPRTQRLIFIGLVLTAGAVAVFLLYRAARPEGVYADDLADVIDLFGPRPGDDDQAAELAPVIELHAGR